MQVKDKIVTLEELKAGLDKKVDTSDVVNNLTSTATDKPLSAAMGKMLEGHIQQSTATAWLKKRENITATTDANGNVLIENVVGDPIRVVLFAWDGQHIFIPLYYHDKWYCRVQITDAAGSALVSTSVTFNIYYMN